MRLGAIETPSVQSVDRILTILELVGRSTEPVPLARLTQQLGVNASSAFRLANTLKRRGFLANPSGGKSYVLGPSMWRLSRDYDWSKMLVGVCHEHLEALVESTSETAHFAVREGRQVFFVDHCASTCLNLVVPGHTGEFAPLHSTAHGKALLADFDERALTALLGGRKLKTYTAKTIGSTARLADACVRLKADGYVVDDGEYLEGVRCVAAPIRDRDGAVIASIGISAPDGRFPASMDAAFGRQVRDAADRVTAWLQADDGAAGAARAVNGTAAPRRTASGVQPRRAARAKASVGRQRDERDLDHA
jgi:DNA-binding IclR family transcriptional regulator